MLQGRLCRGGVAFRNVGQRLRREVTTLRRVLVTKALFSRRFLLPRPGFGSGLRRLADHLNGNDDPYDAFGMRKP